MDIQYLLWLQDVRQAAGPGVESFFCAITTLGMPQYLLIILAAAYYCFDRRAGERAIAACAAGCFVNEFLKLVFCVYRPFVRDARLHVADGAASGAVGYSFPSGHAALCAGSLGSLARSFRKHRAVVIACVTAIVLIVFSRNYLGCHSPQDVVVGIGIGYVAAVLADRVFDWVGDHEGGDLKVLGICLAVSAVAIVIALVKPYPLDYDASGALLYDPEKAKPYVFFGAGFLDAAVLGLVLEHRLVRFEDTRSWSRRLLRVVPGVVLMLAVFALASKLSAFVGTFAGMYLVGLLPVFFLVFVWPLVFVRIERARS